MSDTLFADVSEFQIPVDDRYPYRFISIRANDGDHRDAHLAHNLDWCRRAADSGRITGFIVYVVWEANWAETVNTLQASVGTPHPRMAVMIDVESWDGRYTTDCSAGINAAREAVICWLGGNRKRVIGYGNAGDLRRLWPDRGDCRVVLADYGHNPDFPGKIAHQFASDFATAPFGRCDINSADGFSPEEFAAALGLGGPEPAGSGHTSMSSNATPTTPAPVIVQSYSVRPGDTLTAICGRFPQAWITPDSVARINGINPSLISVGQVLHIGGWPN